MQNELVKRVRLLSDLLLFLILHFGLRFLDKPRQLYTLDMFDDAQMFRSDLLQIEDSSRDPLDPVHHPLRKRTSLNNSIAQCASTANSSRMSSSASWVSPLLSAFNSSSSDTTFTVFFLSFSSVGRKWLFSRSARALLMMGCT
ncbi:hypothetical protein EYF80_002451 [Liparis tanakae]|uniref:Uncharacterized protein n=1 Tax=Liparis tanakae TaxID=230148 RepID=A0A4Z2JAK8_9TELE|nr:hypothetical protein EYF80_002451 [Liparis tanakae]